MDSKLLCKVDQRIKAVAGIKAFLILPVATLHLSVMAGRVGAYQFMLNTQADSSGLNWYFDIQCFVVHKPSFLYKNTTMLQYL